MATEGIFWQIDGTNVFFTSHSNHLSYKNLNCIMVVFLAAELYGIHCCDVCTLHNNHRVVTNFPCKLVNATTVQFGASMLLKHMLIPSTLGSKVLLGV